MSGYASRDYALSFAEFGRPRFLLASEGWILERSIEQSDRCDAMGLYPLFACNAWSRLPDDLDALQDSGLVSLVVVTDPFGDYEEALLHRCFPDLVRSFKQHYVVDLAQAIQNQISKHHRYYARKSLEAVQVEYCPNPMNLLDDWMDMYEVLVSRHQIAGIATFSRLAFAQQLAMPNLTVFRVMHEGRTIGAHLWVLDGDVAYSHLAAFHEDAYRLSASYALYWYAINYFKGHVRWMDLGGGAGLAGDINDGLSKFKRGWSNAERSVYLCGRIFDKAAYAALAQQRSLGPTAGFFPAYR